MSNKDPRQWVCRDFHERFIRPTHYTIWAWILNSWVAEGSLDGNSWTEIDRQPSRGICRSLFEDPLSFAVPNPAEFRFIRLTHTGETGRGRHELSLYAAEFFGALAE
jgi:hypothetical protein